MLRFCFPTSQISCLGKSVHKILCSFVLNMWESENVRLSDWNVRVIFFQPYQMIWFCFPVSQISRLFKKRSENHTPSGAKQCESVRMWDCVTGIWEWYVPCVSSHLRLLESQIKWMGYESDFYPTFTNAQILVPSMSCFSSWKKLLIVHSAVKPLSAKHLRVWECKIVLLGF